MHKELPKNFLQQSIIKASMQPSLRRNYRFSPLSRAGWSPVPHPAEDFCVHPFQLALLFVSLLATVFAKIRYGKYDFAI
jgi:hypothetical protein